MSMSRVELEESEDKRDKEGAPGYRYQVSSTLSISTSLKSKKILVDNDFIGVKLIYNVVLVSGVQQSELVTHTHISGLLSWC